jgi:hypothetical protein
MRLDDEIERLRAKMMQEADEQGSFIHENVVAISQQLDEILVRFQKMRQKHRRMVRFVGRFRMPSRPKSFRHRPPFG